MAIKEVKIQNDVQLADFQREARRMQTLVPHPNVVTFLGVCMDPLTIVTKFYTNGGLDVLLYEKKTVEITTNMQLNWIQGIAYGVNHLHEEGSLFCFW